MDGALAVSSCFDHTLLAARRVPPPMAVLYNHLKYKPEPKPVMPMSASTLKAEVGALKA